MRLNIFLHRKKLLQNLENSDDTVFKPIIKLISNYIEQFYLNDNVKSKTRSSSTVVNQLQPNVKVKKQDESLSNVELKLEPLPNIEIKISEPPPPVILKKLKDQLIEKQDESLSNVEFKLEPLPNIEIKNSEHPPFVYKKLKDQLIEELYYYSSSSEESDDNISVGNNEDWNENFQTHNENDSDNSSIIAKVKHNGQEQLANDKSKEKYMYSSCDNNNPVLDINYSSSRKRLIMNSNKHQNKIKRSEPKVRKNRNRDNHNAKEQASRDHLKKWFLILSKRCSFLNSNRRVPSKVSILLAAKKECDILSHFDKKMLAEKKCLLKANEILRNRLDELYRI